MNNTETPESRLRHECSLVIHEAKGGLKSDILAVLEKLSTLQSQHAEDLGQMAGLRGWVEKTAQDLHFCEHKGSTQYHECHRMECREVAELLSKPFKPVIKLEDLKFVERCLLDVLVYFGESCTAPVAHSLQSALATLNAANPKEKE